MGVKDLKRKRKREQEKERGRNQRLDRKKEKTPIERVYLDSP
jgi:hypothetical protein